MKKTVFIALSLFLAFIITEIIIQFILNYPKYGVESSILGIPYNGKELIYTPHSKYWNVEGGNKVYSRNNAGLQGIDINISPASKYVFVLGNSFVKASEVPPEQMATSIFQKSLSELDNKFQVLNLGFYSHDPYQLLFLSEYFRKIYKPETVILVIERDYGEWMSGYPHPLNFELPYNFGEDETDLKFKLSTFFRNRSSFINLLASALKLSSVGGIDNQTNEGSNADYLLSKGPKELPEELKITLLEFQKTYSNKFILVSIIPKDTLNDALIKFCSINNINCFINSQIMTNPNRLNQNGHLNESGNKLLGEKLYEFFKEYLRKNK